jgi:hypothetical protein
VGRGGSGWRTSVLFSWSQGKGSLLMLGVQAEPGAPRSLWS